MVAIFGASLLFLAMLMSIYSVTVSAAYSRFGDSRLVSSGRNAILSSSALIFLASFILIRELIQSNFSLEYVTKYSSHETPFIYKFGGFWAGMEGSLLFWLFILSIFIVITLYQNKDRHSDLMPWVVVVLGCIQIFFLIICNFFENPFHPVQAGSQPNGMGLNPLLQHPAMLIHPPMLYLGYIGFSVPFAFGMAAMITRKLDSVWIRTTRRWTLFSWLFLSVAIVMGGRWAYVELGWGGYWAWDPVENASFLPWLTGTAYLHSVLIQEKKNMLRLWNMILIMLTFLLTIFGTYLTRSGIVSSVHSFAATDLGIWFFGFVVLIAVVNITMLILRRKDLKSENKLESFASRESGFLFNNMLFVSMMLVVLWGTMYPVLSEAVTGVQITVGSPYFNRIMVPIGLLLLMLTGIGPLLAWRKTSSKSIRKNFLIPASGAVTAAILFILIMGNSSVYPVVSTGLITFVSLSIFMEFYRGVRARRRKTNESPLPAFFAIVNRNRSRYGGYIVHVGIIMMFAGFTGKAFDKEANLSLNLNERGEVGKYEFTYSGYWLETPESHPEARSNHVAKVISIKVSKRGEEYVQFHPEKRFYTDQNNQPHSEVSLKSTLNEDLYLVLGDVDMETGLATMKVKINPMVSWVWMGTLVLIIGALISLNFGALFNERTKT